MAMRKEPSNWLNGLPFELIHTVGNNDRRSMGSDLVNYFFRCLILRAQQRMSQGSWKRCSRVWWVSRSSRVPVEARNIESLFREAQAQQENFEG